MRENQLVQFKLMLPADLKTRIEAAAKESRRSLSQEIVGILEEKYPAPTRSFNVYKWTEHQEFVEKRSREIFAEIDAIIERFGNPNEISDALREKFDTLMREHEKLWKYDIEDDRFHDLEYPSADDET